jgi:hypothetical protein
MKLTTLTAKAAFAIECVPDNTKRFVAEVNKTREALRAERQAKLAVLDAPKPQP